MTFAIVYIIICLTWLGLVTWICKLSDDVRYWKRMWALIAEERDKWSTHYNKIAPELNNLRVLTHDCPRCSRKLS